MRTDIQFGKWTDQHDSRWLRFRARFRLADLADYLPVIVTLRRLFMTDDVSEVQQLRQKLNDAMQVLASHVAAHPETKFSQEHLLLLLGCRELERHLDRLVNRRTLDTAPPG